MHSQATSPRLVATPPADRFHAVVEITPRVRDGSHGGLLALAYAASRAAPVMAVLNGLTRREMDARLDPVVARLGLDVRGVVYADAEDGAAVLAAAGSAALVVALSPSFRATLVDRRIAHCGLAEGIGRLRALAGEAPPRRRMWIGHLVGTGRAADHAPRLAVAR